MSDALISAVLTQLASIMEREIRQEVRLVVGVTQEIQKLTSTFQAVQAVLADAEKRQVKEEAIKIWLAKLRDVSYNMDDVLAEWATAILKLQIEGVENMNSAANRTIKQLCSFITFPCFCLNRVVLRHDIARKIKGINERLDVIATEKDRYKFNLVVASGEEPERLKTSSFVDLSEVRGRDEEKNTLVSKLVREGISSQADRGLHIVSIVGMGGIGKTTLAQLAYNSDDVRNHFETRIWVCVSDPFDEIRVAKAIVEDVEGNAPNFVELETALRRVRSAVVGRKFLLVLDDVWTEDYRRWEPLRNSLTVGASGSKILVTTRNERVALMVGTSYVLRLGQLSDQDCWYLFSQIAFFERTREDCEELEDIGKKIAGKCKGLPLAAKTIGGLMRFKNSLQDWQNVLNSEIWELEEAERGLFPPLLLSYYDLPSAMKQCFSYCAIFPKDYKIETDNLIKLWMAQGYLSSRSSVEMEIKGREYLENLVMLSFFQDLEKDKEGEHIVRFKMHDMVHDFAQFLTKNECIIMEVDSGGEQIMESIREKFRHATLIRADEAPFRVPQDNTEKLRSFWVQAFYDCPPLVSEIDRVQPGSLHSLTCLRALDLSRNRLCELPKEVGKLLYLRYLNLSHNPLWELPEMVCDLCNLQTLKLVACGHLRQLPQNIGKLINLRHLEIDRTNSLKMLPKGVGRLTSLRTLSKFIIGGSGDSEEAACKLGDLKNLNFLAGHLKIDGLGSVGNTSEAEEAELKNKTQLVGLHVEFDPVLQAEGNTGVVEALQLHPNLQYIHVQFYQGTQFPSWIMSLDNLRKLELEKCQNCVHLPPLGKLPSLETLYIESMHSLKCVGLEFLGIGMDNNGDNTIGPDGKDGALSSSIIIAFPKLKKLKIGYMRSWEEWKVISTGRRSIEENVRIMPCLRLLKLFHCNKLKALPECILQIAPLKKLRIVNCPILWQQYQQGIGDSWIKISHIPKVRIS